MKKALKTTVYIILILIAIVLGLNIYVTAFAGRHIAKANLPTDADCIIVPGAGLLADGTPSLMLKERLDCAIEMYFDGVCTTLLFSGDHASDSYDEVNAMRRYAEKHGVDPDDIILDHSGFSTYDTAYRAKNVFGVKKAIVTTQKYHLYRAVYDARAFGIDAVGVDCQHTVYRGFIYREARETVARCKDFFACIFKPKPI